MKSVSVPRENKTREVQGAVAVLPQVEGLAAEVPRFLEPREQAAEDP
jgi:hypothetical protein